MFVSVIIPTYKDIVALALILEALDRQTYKEFEVVVAEDDNAKDVQIFLKNYKAHYPIKHQYHENIGNRKAIIMNKALRVASGEYVIMIDGDTIPYTTFVESHVMLSEKDVVLCGRRVNLGDKVSSDLRNKKITAMYLEKNFIKSYRYIKNDNSRHYEQGIYIYPNSVLYKLVRKFDNNLHIVASNFSCHMSNLMTVNGFDEDLPFAPNRDDTDLEWRMIASGCLMKSCKYTANMFHLNHVRDDRKEEGLSNMKIIQEKQRRNEFVCKNGILKLDNI